MKKPVYLILIVLFVFILGACATATPDLVETPSQSIEGMINPGDKIGDFLITTGDEEEVTYGWELDECTHQDDKTINWCPITVGTKVNASMGIYGYNLDEKWSSHTYEMVIEGHPVNLQAFGSINITHPIVGQMRYWNVVVVTDKPGEIIVTSKLVVGGDPSEDTTTYSFNSP